MRLSYMSIFTAKKNRSCVSTGKKLAQQAWKMVQACLCVFPTMSASWSFFWLNAFPSSTSFHFSPLCIENICLKLLCEYYILNTDASILTNSSITFVPFSVNIAPATVPRHFLRSQSAVTSRKEIQSTYFQVLSCWGKIARQFHGSATSWLYRVVVLKWSSRKKLCYELFHVNL